MNVTSIQSPARLDSASTNANPPTAPLRFSTGVALVVFATYFFTTNQLNENLQTVGLFALLGAIVFIDNIARTWWVWVVIAISLAAGVAMRPLDIPNHHILLTLIALTFALCLSAPEEQRLPLLQNNARWLLVAIIGIATLHRLLQPSFMNGSYIGYEIVTGEFLHSILQFFPGVSSIIIENRETAETFRNSPASGLQSVALTSPVPMLPALSIAIATITIAFGAWICLAMLAWPSWIGTHISLMAFALSLALVRQEFPFTSVICMLGLLSCNPQWKKLRWSYGILTALFAAAVIKTVNLPGPLQ